MIKNTITHTQFVRNPLQDFFLWTAENFGGKKSSANLSELKMCETLDGFYFLLKFTLTHVVIVFKFCPWGRKRRLISHSITVRLNGIGILRRDGTAAAKWKRTKGRRKNKSQDITPSQFLPTEANCPLLWGGEGPIAVLLMRKFGVGGDNSSKERLQLFTPSSTYWTCFPFAPLIFHHSTLRGTFHPNPNESKWRSGSFLAPKPPN